MKETEDSRPESIAVPEIATNELALPPDDSEMLGAVREYLAALEAGQKPARQTFLARYPQCAKALGECLDALDFVHSAGPQLQLPGEARLSAVSASAALIQPEALLGDYRIVRELGRGGMGVVYEALQISLGRRVALKLLPFAAALDPKQLQRFKNEAQAAACLQHQNIVPVYGLGCERGVHYYAMQFIDGQTMAALIHELRQSSGLEPEHESGSVAAAGVLASDLLSGRLAPAGRGAVGEQLTGSSAPLSQAADAMAIETGSQSAAAPSTERAARGPSLMRMLAHFGVQAAEALEHAHQLGVVHRDIKPANLLIDLRGNLWITDFGLAHFRSHAALTMTGDLVGTLRYMSPEQALAQRLVMDHRTDVYSLGATLYELLTLEPAFGGNDRQELLRQIGFEEPRPPRRLNRAIPAELETVVLKAMAKNPEERYATARELADDLERYLKDQPIRAKRPTLWQRARKWSRRHKAMVGASLAVLIVALTATLLVMWRESQWIRAALKQADQQRQAAEARGLVTQANFQQACVLLNNAALDHQIEWLTKQGASKSGEQVKGLEKALALYQNFLIETGPDPAERLLTAYVSIRVGEIHVLLDHRAEAAQAYRNAIVLLQQLVAEFPQEVGFRSSLAKAHFQVAWLRNDPAHPQEAEEDYRRAISLYEDLRNEFPDVAWYTRELGFCWFKLAGLQRCGGRFQLGEESHRRALALRQLLCNQLPNDSEQRHSLAESHGELAWVLAIRPDRETRHTTEALVHARKAVELDPGNHDRWHTLGVAHCRAGNWQEALAALEKSKKLQPDGDEMSSFQSFFEAMAHAKLGDRNEARRYYDQGVRWMTKHSPNHADLRRFRAEAAVLVGDSSQQAMRDAD